VETIEMKHDIPAWAKQSVNPEDHDYSEVSQLYNKGKAQIHLTNLKDLKGWAKSQNWPTPWFGFKEAFIAKLFASQEAFKLALRESGIKIHIPISEHIINIERLKKLDGLYEEKQDMGVLGQRATGWGTLVSELREVRHLVEAGVKVKVEGTQAVLTSFQKFYDWAHGRYSKLEDGHDSWIGDDNS